MHKATLETSRNLCSWFAEGLANRYGSFAAMGGNYLDGGFHSKADYGRGLAWLGSVDPETVDDDAAWWLYGGMAGAVVQYLGDSYGSDKPRAVVRALAAFPQVEGGYVYAEDDAACRGYLAEAIRGVLGLDMAAFEAGWREWLAAYRPKG